MSELTPVRHARKSCKSSDVLHIQLCCRSTPLSCRGCCLTHLHLEPTPQIVGLPSSGLAARRVVAGLRQRQASEALLHSSRRSRFTSMHAGRRCGVVIPSEGVAATWWTRSCACLVGGDAVRREAQNRMPEVCSLARAAPAAFAPFRFDEAFARGAQRHFMHSIQYIHVLHISVSVLFHGSFPHFSATLEHIYLVTRSIRPKSLIIGHAAVLRFQVLLKLTSRCGGRDPFVSGARSETLFSDLQTYSAANSISTTYMMYRRRRN